MGFFIALLFVWLPCAFYASHVAADKSHDGAAWFFGGFLFGPIALIAAAGLGDQKLRRYQLFQAEAQGLKGAITTANDASWKEETTGPYPKLN